MLIQGGSRTRKGVGLLAVLPNLLLMLGIGAGILYALYQGTPTEIVDSVVSGVMSPFLLLIEKIFGLIVPVSPVLVALIPSALILRRDNDATLEQLLWGAGYGLALFVLVVVTGIDVRIMAETQASWTGSLIVSSLGFSNLGQSVLGFFMFVTYWAAGLVLEIFVLMCQILAGTGTLASSASKSAKVAQGRLLTRLSESPSTVDIRAIGIMLITLTLLGSGVYLSQHGFPGTASTLYVDSTPPTIKLAACTQGKIAYPPNGRPTLLCFVSENMDMDSVTAEIKTLGGFLTSGETVDKITLSYDSKTNGVYKYKGTLTKSLNENTEYKLIYSAVNRVGELDKEETSLELVEIAGNVKVNGKEVTSPSQTIYLSQLTCFIEVEIQQGSNSIEHVSLFLNGEQLQSFEAASSGKWVTTYQIPEDGRYSFTVNVLGSGGQSIQFASFGVTCGSTMSPEVLLGAIIGIVAAGALLIYIQKREESVN